ncbi:DUF3265 domain-containing protein [Vibrio alginolyticus]|nr:DUF3265 domain-containing protein [Vibrio alginolyticus]
MSKHITTALRRIQHAWHFYYAFVLVIKTVCGGISIVCVINLNER